MKRIKLLAVCGLFAFGISSCGSDLSCSEANSNTSDAADAYGSDNSEANCLALKAAYKAVIDDSDCSDVVKATAQVAINVLPC